MLSQKKQFFEQYAQLKKQENWRDIIELGNQALSIDLTDTQKALVCNRLTSCYFYLGQYADALESSKIAFSNAKASGDIEQQARAIYLISAVYRAQKNKEESRKYIDTALKFTNKNISDFTKAKIYFNAGALEQDLDNNPEKASKSYSIAMSYFEPGSDDYARTAIRNIRCFLELGKISIAKLESERLTIDPNTKTFVHFLQLKSKIDIAQERYGEAYQRASQALEIAKAKDMTQEVERLKSLISDTFEKYQNVISASRANRNQDPSFSVNFS